MTNNKSSEKRVQIGERNRVKNKARISSVKNAIKKVQEAISTNTDEKEDILKNAVKIIDTVAGKGTIHKNKASRLKSRLTKKVNKTK
ncbi:MAG: 30S ribosomal protein S20 [Candidatus Margulisiibacteriota bacterium]|nr:MAG: 30S ribosomal protein S20 [Candidatus Margulisbacteria bacterium GWD2_39_127]OGI02491.1 MAG: 30S ribosomal protein S20 [Candidatus Margulisbacteria bacterium GWF2_38_17]OGI10984.1 MAG: 30S ribosomal protein S20 [Candidatus Margulisbacteria bacterium GWE2_39_32]PZM83178.1 MAG: 30S ribosomal protein S20 [Candidatus Margulisiibacteriota bacterium]HAR62519.1 30S ribosomal protein S20 [Candidatus Margulisiibacteriota bacterium]